MSNLLDFLTSGRTTTPPVTPAEWAQAGQNNPNLPSSPSDFPSEAAGQAFKGGQGQKSGGSSGS